MCCLILISAAIGSGEKRFTPGSCVNYELRSPDDSSKYRFVGIEKCSSVCHNNDKMGFQYDIVRNGPHSNAYKVLLSEKAKTLSVKAGIIGDPVENAVCLKCHTTGSGLDTSFYASTYRKEEGVTCEACHKGAFRSKTYIPQENDCVLCHNNSVHEVPSFYYKKDCAKIVHPRPKKV